MKITFPKCATCGETRCFTCSYCGNKTCYSCYKDLGNDCMHVKQTEVDNKGWDESTALT